MCVRGLIPFCHDALQVQDLATCIGDRNACYLRFTLYTMDADGGVVEIVNTGMVEVQCLMMLPQQQHEHQAEEDVSEIVMHFGDSGSLVFCFLPAAAAAPAPGAHEAAAGAAGAADDDENACWLMFSRLRTLQLVRGPPLLPQA